MSSDIISSLLQLLSQGQPTGNGLTPPLQTPMDISSLLGQTPAPIGGGDVPLVNSTPPMDYAPVPALSQIPVPQGMPAAPSQENLRQPKWTSRHPKITSGLQAISDALAAYATLNPAYGPQQRQRMAIEKQNMAIEQEREQRAQGQYQLERRQQDRLDREEQTKINTIAYNAALKEVGVDSPSFGEVFMKKLKSLQDAAKDNTILGPANMEGGKVGVFVMTPDNKVTSIELPGAIPTRLGSEEDKAIADHLAAKGLPNTAENRDAARRDLKSQPEQQQAIKDYLGAHNLEDNAKNRDRARLALKERQAQINIQLGTAQAVQGNTPQERLAKVPPDIQPIVKAVSEYRMPLPSSFALRSPYWTKILSYVNQVDPTFNAMNYPVRQRMMLAYTQGQQGKEINAINTVLGHVSVLGNSLQALNNNDIPALNAIANALSIQSGKDPVTTFRAIVNRVGPEVTRAYVGTGGEFAERKQNEGDFNPNYSPEQIKNNVRITVRLLRSKIGSLENQWNQTMGKDDFEQRFITPEAERAIQDWAPSSLSTGETNSPTLNEFMEKYGKGKK